jgi:hypothetical protein
MSNHKLKIATNDFKDSKFGDISDVSIASKNIDLNM